MKVPVNLTNFKNILLKASEIIKGHLNKSSEELGTTKKQDGTSVTKVELEVNKFLKLELTKLLPDSGWLSEEDKDNTDRLTKSYVWVVDPIDGTKEFISGIPEIAISVGLVSKGLPILGGVVNPATGEGGVGSLDNGVEYWGSKSRIVQTSLVQAEISVSRTEFSKGQIDVFREQLPQIKPLGSVAYKLLRVAAEQDDFYFSVEPKSEWDICGGVALLGFSNKFYSRFDGAANAFNQPKPRIKCGACAGTLAMIENFSHQFKALLQLRDEK
ncbi:MAG: inositol monophosphatase family protein [Oligoflexia bacterium]|nr:inositol monophosphatase family protein [Oligoflexia bacterium]